MQHLEVSGVVRPLKWPLGVKCLRKKPKKIIIRRRRAMDDRVVHDAAPRGPASDYEITWCLSKVHPV